MTKNLNDIIQTLEPNRKEKIENRAKDLIEEYMTLQDLRKAHQLSSFKGKQDYLSFNR